METSRAFLRITSLLMAGGWSLCPPTSSAAPGSVGTMTSSTATVGNGAGRTTVTTSAAGGHSAHASVGAASRPTAPAGGGFRPATGAGNVATSYHSPLGVSRSAGTATGPGPRAAQPAPERPVVQMPTVHNAWTDPVSSRVAGETVPASRLGGPRGIYNRPGNHLYPGAFGYTPTHPVGNHVPRRPFGDDGRRYHHRYYYNNFPYAIYSPGFYGNYGYGGVGTYGYPALTTDYSGFSTANSVADLGAPDFSNIPTNYYSYTEPEQATPDASAANAPSAQPLPDAPGVGPQSPASADGSTGAPVGPDSLVEAVQDELFRRGYYAGKADSLYSVATKEAIRRFQADQHLPATGRINEATLHALRLD